jgi:hypothetical protein
MRIWVMAAALGVAAIASGAVWLVTSSTVQPFVEDRPYCSGMVNLPDGPSDIGLPSKTFPPRCRFGPIPADRLAPNPLPALATFIALAGAGLAVSVRTARKPPDPRQP